MSFITIHLVSKILESIKLRQRTLKHEGFFYFDEPIKVGKFHINRVNGYSAFNTGHILPVSFYQVNGQSLMEIYDKIKSNKFYANKRLDDGKDYKVRIKKT